MKDERLRLRAVVAQCFPEDARVIALPRQADLVLAISWRLQGDPSRPYMRSKTILLHIDANLVDLYCLARTRERTETDECIAVAIRDRLISFDPRSCHGPRQEPEVVSWIISE